MEALATGRADVNLFPTVQRSDKVLDRLRHTPLFQAPIAVFVTKWFREASPKLTWDRLWRVPRGMWSIVATVVLLQLLLSAAAQSRLLRSWLPPQLWREGSARGWNSMLGLMLTIALAALGNYLYGLFGTPMPHEPTIRTMDDLVLASLQGRYQPATNSRWWLRQLLHLLPTTSVKTRPLKMSTERIAR